MNAFQYISRPKFWRTVMPYGALYDHQVKKNSCAKGVPDETILWIFLGCDSPPACDIQ